MHTREQATTLITTARHTVDLDATTEVDCLSVSDADLVEEDVWSYGATAETVVCAPRQDRATSRHAYLGGDWHVSAEQLSEYDLLISSMIRSGVPAWEAVAIISGAE